MTNKKLNDEQLDKVNGGSLGGCEPKPYPFRMDGTDARTPNVICSDITNKGLKPECVGCKANK